jgi:DNA-binding PadR family transcriptional regulator
MFRHFDPHLHTPEGTGGNCGSQFFASEKFGQRQRRRGAFGEWGDKPRTRRGDIKFILLELLSERPQHGYELIKELENRRGGFRRPSPGSVYPTLQMLEESDYLTGEQIDDKRVYTITESGRQLLDERKQQLGLENSDDGFTVSKSSELSELRRTLTELNDAVGQAARSGNTEQVNQVRELLIQVKREVYKLLAQM